MNNTTFCVVVTQQNARHEVVTQAYLINANSSNDAIAKTASSSVITLNGEVISVSAYPFLGEISQ